MKIFQKLKVTSRVQVIINISFCLMFVVIVTFFYIERKNRLLTNNMEGISRDIDELAEFVDNHLKKDREILSLSVNVADDKINQHCEILEDSATMLDFTAVDPYTNEPIGVKIPKWIIDKSELLKSYNLVDGIKKITNADISIYQKCERGYVNVSTTYINSNGERMIGEIILNSSPIVKAIESGNPYTNRLLGKSAWYSVSYKAIEFDGQIKGIYFVGLRERMGAALKQVFKNRRYYKSGYPFLLADNGYLLVHPSRPGEDFSGTNIYKSIVKQGKSFNSIQYQWPETGKGEIWEIYYKFHEPSRSYICITYPMHEMNASIYLVFVIGLLGFIVFFVIVQFIIILSMDSLKSKLKVLRQILNKLAKGEPVTADCIGGEKEFIEIADRASNISERNKSLCEFAQGLANDNYSQTYPKTFLNDEIGEALIKINDKLNEAMYNEHIRQKEEKLRSWESEGLSKFVYILQRNRDKLEDLCYDLISNLVEYLNANLGAIFFLNSENPEDIHFMQMATYAFEQKKILDKKIYPEQGLIGRIYTEKQTIYLSEIPEGYITITSGLGESAPKNLLIVPLLINKEVYGAIEIASFNILKGYQIEFIEKIGENIASTINNVLVNNKTRELLEQSRAQSRLLSDQEEKMRKNLIELKSIQKETESGIYEMKDVFKLLEEMLLMVKITVGGEIVSLNQRVADFFSMEKFTLVGKHYSDYSHFVPVDEYKVLINSWEKLMKGENVQITIKVKSGIGKVNSIFLNMIPEFENRKVNCIALVGFEISGN
jgi:hypothetical protein